jgi:fatty acid-binding protein DegV
MAIRIVTDSSSDLPPALAEQWNITVVPCNVVIDDVNYKDGVDLMPDEFFRRLPGAARLPTTSQPTVSDSASVPTVGGARASGNLHSRIREAQRDH